jgi:glycosyltransferase involved in cell wall biosynthesis
MSLCAYEPRYNPPVLVSTIIPVHNRAAMLRDAVASVVAQTYRPIEIVIVDDGSTDDTAGVADSLASDEIIVIHQPNGGPGAAREAGRLRARGAFVQYLDSDDLLLPRKFELQVAGLLAHSECGASYGWTRLRRADGSVEAPPWKRTGERIDAMFPSMLASRWWDTSTPLWRRETLDAAGAWTTLKMEEDWEYDCRIAAVHTRLHHVPQWLSETREHDARLTGRTSNPDVLRDRAAAHALIHAHARRAGITPEAAEMQHFARELFLLARQCGAAGLAEASRMLFRLARDASGEGAKSLQFRAYALLTGVVGWRLAGRLACMSDKLRA